MTLQQIANLPDIAITSLLIGQCATMVRAESPTSPRTGIISRRIQRINEESFVFVDESRAPQNLVRWEAARIIPENQRVNYQPVRSIFNYSIVNILDVVHTHEGRWTGTCDCGNDRTANRCCYT
jgi:hypothetical protein